jgi:hypothetical protein
MDYVVMMIVRLGVVLIVLAVFFFNVLSSY